VPGIGVATVRCGSPGSTAELAGGLIVEAAERVLVVVLRVVVERAEAAADHVLDELLLLLGRQGAVVGLVHFREHVHHGADHLVVLVRRRGTVGVEEPGEEESGHDEQPGQIPARHGAIPEVCRIVARLPPRGILK
jgi:hypothetical protein